MSKFKAGDKVRRIAGEYHGMIAGDTATVKSVHISGLKLEEYDVGYGYHDERNFVLVNTTLSDSLGAKYDGGKLLFRALTRGLALPLRAVAAVLTYGALKYKEDSWQHVPDAKARYESALDRHLNAWKAGEECDEESGLPHLAHAACNALFLLWFDITDGTIKGDYTKFNQPPKA
jgi:hypothetical protein